MARNTKEKGEKKGYRVLDTLDHDGERYAAGDTVALTQAEAAALAPCKVIEAGAEPEPEPAAAAQ